MLRLLSPHQQGLPYIGTSSHNMIWYIPSALFHVTWGFGKPSALHSTWASEPCAKALSVGSKIQRGGTEMLWFVSMLVICPGSIGVWLQFKVDFIQNCCNDLVFMYSKKILYCFCIECVKTTLVFNSSGGKMKLEKILLYIVWWLIRLTL